MILIGQYDSPFVRRVAITLHHYEMPFSRQPLSVFSDFKKFGMLNPLVRVPALILDSGESIIDSNVIIDYLDHIVGPKRALTPDHGLERRKILKAVALATGAMEKTMATFFERYYHEGKGISKDWEQRCLFQINAALTELEKSCGTPWFSNLQMTQADVTIGCLVGYIKLRVPEAFPADQFVRLHRLSNHCEMREEFTLSRPAADEVVPARS